MYLMIKTQLFFIRLLMCHVCVTQVSVLGSQPNDCETNIRNEYQNVVPDTPKNYFLYSFIYHCTEIFNLMPIPNVYAENYYAALYESISNVMSTLLILSPREFCQIQYLERKYYTCIEAISYLRVHDISDVELHAEIPGQDIFRFMYFERVFDHIRTSDPEKHAMVRGYYLYLYEVAQRLDFFLFPTITNFCNNPGDFEDFFEVEIEIEEEENW